MQYKTNETSVRRITVEIIETKIMEGGISEMIREIMIQGWNAQIEIIEINNPAHTKAARYQRFGYMAIICNDIKMSVAIDISELS